MSETATLGTACAVNRTFIRRSRAQLFTPESIFWFSTTYRWTSRSFTGIHRANDCNIVCEQQQEQRFPWGWPWLTCNTSINLQKIGFEYVFTPNQYGLAHGSLKSWPVLKDQSWQKTWCYGWVCSLQGLGVWFKAILVFETFRIVTVGSTAFSVSKKKRKNWGVSHMGKVGSRNQKTSSEKTLWMLGVFSRYRRVWSCCNSAANRFNWCPVITAKLVADGY